MHRARCNEMTFPWKFMKIHYFSQIAVDHILKVSIFSRPNKDLKILQFFYFLKFLCPKIAKILNCFQVFERIRLGYSGSSENSTEKEGTTFLQHSEAKKRVLLRKSELKA